MYITKSVKPFHFYDILVETQIAKWNETNQTSESAHSFILLSIQRTFRKQKPKKTASEKTVLEEKKRSIFFTFVCPFFR